jgi:hypothetical protein
MPEPAFMVEGFLEKELLKKICSGKKVLRLGLNGRNVALEAIVDRIETLASLLNNRYHPIVVVFDREERNETSPEIVDFILDALKQRGRREKFIIGVPDRMIENWILADRAVLRELQYGRLFPASQNLDGRNGKSLLKQCFGDRPYRETMEGVALLRRGLASVIRRRSPSFQAFSKSINFRCHWLLR